MMNVLDTMAKQQEQQQRHDEARVASYLLSNNSTLWIVVIWLDQAEIRAGNVCVCMFSYSWQNTSHSLPTIINPTDCYARAVGGLLPFRGGFSCEEFGSHSQKENVNIQKPTRTESNRTLEMDWNAFRFNLEKAHTPWRRLCYSAPEFVDNLDRKSSIHLAIALVLDGRQTYPMTATGSVIT